MVYSKIRKYLSKSMQFASNGKYTGKSKKANAELIKMTDSVLRSQKISASLTTTAQKKTALQKLFNYSKKYGYMRMKGFDGKPLQFTKGKSQMFAYLTMGMEKGNCYGVASAFAVQAKRATGLPVRVCWGKSNVFNKNKWQPHGWTETRLEIPDIHLMQMQQETNPEKMLNIICRNLHP